MAGQSSSVIVTRKAFDLKTATPFVFLMIAGTFLTVFLISKGMDFRGDEPAHFSKQILPFLKGDRRFGEMITTLPGYHAAIALVMKALDLDSLAGARGVHVAFSFGVVMLFWSVCHKFYPSMEALKTSQFAFCPLIFSYFFMIYTDILAVGFVLLSFYFMKSERLTLSAIFGLLSCLVRQDTIIWVLFIFTYSLLSPSQNGKPWRLRLRRGWAFFLVFGLFLVFLILNKGIAIHEKRFHPAFQIYSGNIYLFGCLYFFLFLPQNLLELWRKTFELGRYFWLLIACVVLCFFIYHLTFHVTHPFNAPNYWGGCLRNKLLAFGQQSLLKKFLFLVPVLGGLVAIALQSFQHPQDRLLLLFGPLSLAPHWLIEVRYEMVFLTLFILFRNPKNRVMEIGTVIFFAAASILLFAAIYSGKYFP